MADDTGILLFGLVVFLGMGILFWKLIDSGATATTSFTRDAEGRIIEIIEIKR